MKKIDLHIHTVPSPISDSNFTFEMEKLKEYVNKMEIDCIAITNHNLFDKNQFEEICKELSDIKVFPGIEIDLEKGHILLISENENLDDFYSKCNQITALIKTKDDCITYEQLIQCFPLLDKYLLIPHYDKKPIIKEDTLAKFGSNIFAGEVTSVRKFKSCLKEDDRLTPVIFSDCRFSTTLREFPTRQTYIDAEETTLTAIKGCLFDKNKVFLAKDKGNDYFQATDSGVILSTGLNVVIGERSTGKTHTLNSIEKNGGNVKYIRQFSLLEKDEEKFKEFVTKKHSLVSDTYLKEFKNVVIDIVGIDIKANEKIVEDFLISLKENAFENDKRDVFSKCKLYDETKFDEVNLEGLKKLIDATQTLIDNNEYRDIIDKHILITNLKLLVVDLINKYKEIDLSNRKKKWTNELIEDIKNGLTFHSTTVPIKEVDVIKIQKEKIKVYKFEDIVKSLREEKEIGSKQIRNFRIVARTKRYENATALKKNTNRQIALLNAYNNYENPYNFLNALKEAGVEESEAYKFFVDIEYKTLNKFNVEVSGGERSEFNLLHEIQDALKYDMLMIDEPESSFDNIFLKNEVNELLKDISKQIPVVIVTHNNTIGASIKPNHLVYTKKEIENGKAIYKVFFGNPTSKKLKSPDGEEIQNLEIMLNCLEAGEQTYYERQKQTYEILKN
ncbi:PHP domain-containing protein [Capnocytophaga stomatis]|uniref:PHP domain-containing protein n=1 Tax=Capnocytophaga stomatis TaxID=1848904 RepID=A0ABW8Q7U4_9FLAO